MEIQIKDKEKCDLFFKLFPVLFDTTLGNFESFVLKVNKDGLFINQRDISTTTQLDLRYSKNAFDYVSDEEVYIKFQGNAIRPILEAAKQTMSDDSGIILKFTDSINPYLQVLTTQKHEIWLELVTKEDKRGILPYTVEKYANISDLGYFSKLISTLGTILDKRDTAAVEFELRKDLLILHAADEGSVKHAHYKIGCTTNTETIQRVVGHFHHLNYLKKLIDAGAESLKLYIQTDNNFIFNINFAFEINITIYAARRVTSE